MPAVRDASTSSISLRDSIVGGRLRDPKLEPEDLFTRQDRILLLIHGFNVTQVDADRSYAIFERELSDGVRESVVRLYWPGDSSTEEDNRLGQQGTLSRWLSAASYSWKPPIARLSAEKLRDLLGKAFGDRAEARRSRPLELCIVAHSLGCRLILETIQLALIAKRNVDFALTVLMAAAVPEYMVTGTGTLASAVNQLPELWILHSRGDTVLRRWFRPGQLFEHAGFPNLSLTARGALGRKGLKSTKSIKVLEGEWDHSDYWFDHDVAHAVDDRLMKRPTLNNPFETLARLIGERIVRERRAGHREVAEVIPNW